MDEQAMSIRNYNTLEACYLLRAVIEVHHYHMRYHRMYAITARKWIEEWRLHLNNEAEPSFTRFLEQHPMPNDAVEERIHDTKTLEDGSNTYVMNRIAAERRRVQDRDGVSTSILNYITKGANEQNVLYP
jgi:hypothetical protein